MRIILIQPPFTIFKTEAKKCHPPLGLAYLAAILKNNHEIVVLDALAEGYEEEKNINKEYLRYGLSFEDIKRKINYFSPDIVGISCPFSAQAENVYRICRIVKEIDRKIITILGGAHPSAVPEEALRDSNVDFVVIGEGEITFKKILECIENKEDIKDIEGVGFRYNGYVKINQRNRYQVDLDSLPFPYWDIFPLEKYFKINNPHGSPTKRVPFIPIITSRGCPFECIFCSVHSLWGRNYRIRSAENVLMELDYSVNKFGIKEILFEDDNLTLDKERAMAIFKGMINRVFNLTWSVPNGVALQTLDDEMLELMKMSGCHSISIGVESGDEYILKNIVKKPIALSKVKPVIHKAKELGLETTVFFVIGFPGESPAQLKNTLRFAENLEVDNINFFFATPLPGTPLLELCKEKGLIKGKLDYTALKSEYPVFATKDFSIDSLISVISHERLKLYLLSLLRNPKKFLHKLWYKLLSNPGYFVKFGQKYFKIK